MSWMVALLASEVGRSLVAKSDPRNLVVPFIVLLAAILLGCAGVYLARRWIRNDKQPVGTEPFTLDQLRRLHGAGDLTDEEYDRAKTKLVARVKERAVQADSPPPENGDRGKPHDGEGRPSS